MTLSILKEPPGELRVVCLPEIASQLVKMNFEVLVEKTAGDSSYAFDGDYLKAGCKTVSRSEAMQADFVLSINRPTEDEIKGMKNGASLLCAFQPLFNKELVMQMLNSGLTSYSMDMVPRTTRAQSMDILSSQATVAGYKAVLEAAVHLPKFFPMFMTAAGSITPAKVLILGAGVAGLQAISTARRLGGVVEAFDTRSAVKEEVKSLGAKFIEVEGAAESAAAGGYAVEQSKEFLEKQKQKIFESACKADVIVSTAQIPGKKAPVLIPQETVAAMKAGSVIVDLAASTGGNCELTKNNETITTENGVIIIGNSNLPATLPADASKMYGKNVLNFLKLILKDGTMNVNLDDDIVRGTCITHQKQIISPRLKETMSPSAA
jgi:NAD(P) transhydrogenase subunit alpha